MATTKWVTDPDHSQVQFKAKHMLITTVTGEFKTFHIEADTEGEDFMKSKISFWADTASVNTNSEGRDKHLRSADLFDSDNHPRMTFEATGSKSVDGDGSYELQGNLTIRGITHHVSLGVEFGGVMKDPWGNAKAGFTISGKINRRDWGLNWNVPLDAGGLLVSEEIRFHCEVQLMKAG